MKILNKLDLLKLPSGTLYSDFNDGYCDGLFIKGENIVYGDGLTDDFQRFEFLSAIAPSSENGLNNMFPDIEGLDLEIDLSFSQHTLSREGYFDDDFLYAVYSKEEIMQMAFLISKCTGHEHTIP